MKKKQWHELLMPTLLVGGAWLLVSAASSAYIYWLDSFHRYVMTDNVTSIRAVARMQHGLWQLQLHKPGAEADFRKGFASASESATTPEEKELIAAIDAEFTEYVAHASADSATSSPTSLALLSDIVDKCDRIRSLNVEIMKARLSTYEKWVPIFSWGRLVLVVVGPFVGVWLGYRVASRLSDRIAAINVSLDGTSRELGEVQLSPSARDGDLDTLDLQVQTVAVRFQEMLMQLDDARREAIRNERLAAIGHLAAGVAHEIRNPLTAVKLLVQNAGQKAAVGAWSAEQLVVVREEIGRIERIIQDLLDFAKPTLSQKIRRDIGETIQRAVRLVQGRADQSEIRIEVTNKDGPLDVIGDPEQLHQVFINLLMNGMDAMSPGGKLSIEITRSFSERNHHPSTPPSSMEGVSQKEMCQIAVRDDGSGIPPDLVDRIFEPFVTSKARGTGLGLAISRQIVEAHGGQLTAMNRRDRGAEFVISLPIAKTLLPVCVDKDQAVVR